MPRLIQYNLLNFYGKRRVQVLFSALFQAKASWLQIDKEKSNVTSI
jgi:hypothetical protein